MSRHGRAQVLKCLLAGGASLGLVILAGCGVGAGKSSESVLKTSAAPEVVKVRTAPVEEREVVRTVDAVGTLKGWEDVTLGAKRDGRVVKVLHDMGDRVAPGELLVQLETEDADLEILQAQRQFQAELAKLGLNELPRGEFDVTSIPAVVQARVAIDKAQQNLGRERSLIQRNAGTMQDFQNAENDERSAEAALANAILTAQSTLAGAQALKVAIDVARHKRDEMEVHVPVPPAPPEGITGKVEYAIARKQVSDGQMLKQGDPMVKLVIQNPLRLWLNVPERYSREVEVDQSVALSVASHPGTTFEGKVARINPTVDDTSRTFQVEAVIPNSRGLLRPGGFAKASIVVNRKDHAVTVPIEAISTFAGVTKLFVVEDGKTRAIPVEIGLQGDGWVEVIGQVPASAQVVVEGQSRLAEGTAVVQRDLPAPNRTGPKQPGAGVRDAAVNPIAQQDQDEQQAR